MGRRGKLDKQWCQSTLTKTWSGKHEMWPRPGGDRQGKGDRAASIPLSTPCVLVTHLHSSVRHTVFLSSLRPLLLLCPTPFTRHAPLLLFILQSLG